MKLSRIFLDLELCEPPKCTDAALDTFRFILEQERLAAETYLGSQGSLENWYETEAEEKQYLQLILFSIGLNFLSKSNDHSVF